MRADRLLSLMLLLQANKRMTAISLAQYLEVSERTIYRDIDALSNAGIPIYTQSGTNGGIFIDENYRVSLTGLSKSEIQSLFVTGATAPLRDLGLERPREGSLLKLLAALPSIHRHEAERMRERIYIDASGWFDWNTGTHHLPLLQDALWHDRAIEMSYQRLDGHISRRIVEPYALVAKSNVWYLVARQVNGSFRTFRTSRIQEASLTDTCFERDASFKLLEYWHENATVFRQKFQHDEEVAPLEVMLRIPEGLAWYFVADSDNDVQRLTDPDEQGWLSLRIIFASHFLAEIRILGLGDRVQVLSPPELRQKLRQHAESVLAHYQQDE